MGTSPDQSVYCTPQKDHPHAYGDKKCQSTKIAGNWGSSPRVWGQVIGDLDTSAKLGIIPTRMGTSDVNNGVIIYNKDHPHAYGDKYAFSP